MSWYDAIKKTIHQKSQNVADVAGGQGENVILQDAILPEVQEVKSAPVEKTVPLFTNAQGQPLHCIHCSAWQQGGGVWWMGICGISGQRKSNKNKCDKTAKEYI